MTSKKPNCWEYMKCGREPGGENIAELGICRSASDESLNGINSGINGGRTCWNIAGTFCFGKVQGTFAKKLESCEECNFYKSI